MVMHEGELINSKTEWFSLLIVRTTIEKGGVEMTYKPAGGFHQATSRPYYSSVSTPVGHNCIDKADRAVIVFVKEFQWD